MAPIKDFYNRMTKIASEKRFWLLPLGQVEELPIWLVRTRFNSDHKDPKMLVVSGFHGEERAGPYGVLKWMGTDNYNILKRVDLSFIPVVNPVGFKNETRYSIAGEPNNCGFCHPESKEKLSREGQILYKNIDLLRPCAENGFLSLHEDIGVKEFYLYTFEKTKEPGTFTEGLKEVLAQYFHKPLDGVSVEADAGEKGTKVQDGLVYRHCDGSFEDWMFHLGVPRSAVTETPGKRRWEKRVDAGVAVINKFIELCEAN